MSHLKSEISEFEIVTGRPSKIIVLLKFRSRLGRAIRAKSVSAHPTRYGLSASIPAALALVRKFGVSSFWCGFRNVRRARNFLTIDPGFEFVTSKTSCVLQVSVV